jgi:hypothetical protein
MITPNTLALLTSSSSLELIVIASNCIYIYIYTRTCFKAVVRAARLDSVAQVVRALHLLWLGQTSVYKFSLDNFHLKDLSTNIQSSKQNFDIG